MGKISDLLKKYLRIVNSQRNNSNRLFYRKTRSIIIDKFRGIPKDITGDKVPFIYWIGLDIAREIFDIDIGRMYREPLYYLECWLKIKIFYFENFEDCNYFDNFIPIWLGEGFEATFFGCRLKYDKDKEPSVDRNFLIIKDPEKINSITIPDFAQSEAFDFAFDFYFKIKNIVDSYGVETGFFDWHYGPTALCNYLRGFENLSLDFLINKPAIINLMNLVINSRIKWSRHRSKILDSLKIADAVISNDDVCIPNVSPAIYRELIFPFEEKLNEFYGNFSYYHNCGPIDPFLEDVVKLKNIDMIHCGPYSDFRKIGQLFVGKSSIELHLHPEKDFIYMDEENFRRRLKDIKNYYGSIGVKSYCIRLTSYSHPNMSMRESISKLKLWCEISKEILCP